ncbi:Uncharacterised protein [Vibrio cholerae]|nr:Uncharacterised protein [Vibrio cholerae]CSI01225.1 Uncharacterised protein [Vibrio cholerae]CSI64127.1 Uncharacterised protein [Vibrio cholerae]
MSAMQLRARDWLSLHKVRDERVIHQHDSTGRL